MNKQELIDEISIKTGFAKSDIEKTLNAVTNVVVDAIKNNEKVTIIGLGTFELAVRGAREGINPATKQKIKIAAKKVPKFKVAKAFKDAVL